MARWGNEAGARGLFQVERKRHFNGWQRVGLLAQRPGDGEQNGGRLGGNVSGGGAGGGVGEGGAIPVLSGAVEAGVLAVDQPGERLAGVLRCHFTARLKSFRISNLLGGVSIRSSRSFVFPASRGLRGHRVRDRMQRARFDARDFRLHFIGGECEVVVVLQIEPPCRGGC